ncbi:hypothetical protein [Synechococcus sp. KORDI-52]|uniref:hypothetical protein n=1 Tax=Synechococcus sp. KORDI-52 TaxID=585425 RepID=UPI0012EC937A|nr:hypothetical protein [Synechococcus sp. KORDI-52]
MIQATFIAAVILGGALVCPAQADSAVAYCMTSFHKLRRGPTPLRACHFAQYQGNTYIRLADGTRYQFSEKDQGTSTTVKPPLMPLPSRSRTTAPSM